MYTPKHAPPYRISLLGGLTVDVAGQAFTRFRTQKTGGLLGYLAFYSEVAHPRDLLMDLYWPDSPEEAARNYLSKALSSLRQQLETHHSLGPLLQADRFRIGLVPGAAATDVAEFIDLIREAESPEAGDRAGCLRRALSLYRGEFMAGHYEEWVVREQRRFAEAHGQALCALADELARVGDLEEAVVFARASVEAEPLDEGRQVALVGLLASLGRRQAADEQIRAFAEAYQEELGCALAPRTRARLESALSQPSQVVVRSQPARNKESSHEGSKEPSVGVPDPIERPSLPVQFTRFYGRERELEELERLLSDPTERLVTLAGPGGVGKTRLACEAASAAVELFSGRVWFNPLADLHDVRLVPEAILRATGARVEPHRDVTDQLLERLQGARSLLVLDNLEHLLSAERRKSEDVAAVVKLLLERVPDLCCLATSRQPLQLSGERAISVEPLPVPDEDESADEVSANPSVRLFVDRARNVRPDFALTPRNGVDVAALCRQLEGIPLAVELAASRSGILSPGQMIGELKDRFTFLVSRSRDAVARHQTLGAALEWSYRRLPGDSRRFLCMMSVFRGGWTLEAAQWVAFGGDIDDLAARRDTVAALEDLRSISLISAVEEGGAMRYRMLETVREFADSRLSSEDRAIARQRHAEHFLRLSGTAQNELTGAQQSEWLERLESDHQNFLTALEHTASQSGTCDNNSAMAITMAAVLWRFWVVRSHFSEGRRQLARALSLPWNPTSAPARVKALYGAGVLAIEQGEFEAAKPLLAESLDIARSLSDPQAQAQALNALGNISRQTGDSLGARDYYLQVRETLLAAGDKIGAALWSVGLIGVLTHIGDFAQAERVGQEALDLCRQNGDSQRLAFYHEMLGLNARWRGDLDAAKRHHEASMALFRELSNRLNWAGAAHNLAAVLLAQGELQQAQALAEQALAETRSLGQRAWEAANLSLLGEILLSTAGAAEAVEALHESLRIQRSAPESIEVAFCMERLAFAAADMNRPDVAARLLAFASKARQARSITTPVPTRRRIESLQEHLDKMLDLQAMALAEETGRRFSVDDAYREAFLLRHR
jgi:predicted ATPase/DNA-binding SARP family transcriptional activator